VKLVLGRAPSREVRASTARRNGLKAFSAPMRRGHCGLAPLAHRDDLRRPAPRISGRSSIDRAKRALAAVYSWAHTDHRLVRPGGDAADRLSHICSGVPSNRLTAAEVEQGVADEGDVTDGDAIDDVAEGVAGQRR
jgi:hypothetical protein